MKFAGNGFSYCDTNLIGLDVYQARALLAIVNDTVYDDFDLCAEQGYALKTEPFEEEGQDSVLQKEYFIRPNPARSYLFLGLKEGVFDEENVVLFNYLGQQVLEYKPLPLQIDRLDITNLPVGVYTAIIMRKGIKRFKEKVIIQR